MSNGLKCTNLWRLQTCDNQPQDWDLDTIITETNLTDSETDDWNWGPVLRRDPSYNTDWSCVLHILCGLGTSSLVHLKCTSLLRVEWKSSVCVICMKYRIIILIIIIISLGQILLSYISNTSRTHASHTGIHSRTHSRTRTHPPPFRLSLFDGSVAANHDTVNAVNAGSAGDQWPSCRCFFTQIKSRAGDSVFVIVLGVFRVHKNV